MSNYMKELAKATGNEYGSLVDDGIFGGDVTQYIDTGSYAVSYTHLTLPTILLV